ncbi:Crp/Fnr family transcriptional regulator [Mucilaginibacter gotjawali]|uniref:CRP/FNR family transcriptional regulator n=2 Tax=Mucilaginibacter gotjawali TaxID=1550579 RepID=A0A839SN75_9SPHI|nr:Crp/Fnr family transcriptional regulator [Mucilaginibacter gotjawali]MBB3057847.1 CRP/FNR family transcriptional regulator [Mucilaginibacter gotjawali]BAU52381.1 Transcriptional activator protein Anr [Mucilaginibacter gotjawali]
MAKNECDLKSCFLCKFCLKDWIPAIAANRKNFEVKKGQQLFKEGDPAAGIYFIYSGAVKVHKRWDNEKELILRFAKTGDIVGQMGLGPEATYPVSATAIEAGLACFVDMEFFDSTLNINTQFTKQLVMVLANDLKESEKRMRNLAHMPVKGRVAQALINLKNQFGTNNDGYINIELSRQDLASFTGASYESLFRVINDLTEEKLIGVSGKSILIRDTGRLVNLTAETE